MTDEEIESHFGKLTGWQLLSDESEPKLRKSFSFPDFAEALKFTNQVGKLAEAEDHHPEILTEWGRVTVTWWTHSAKGLSEKDFALAARVDAL